MPKTKNKGVGQRSSTRKKNHPGKRSNAAASRGNTKRSVRQPRSGPKGLTAAKGFGRNPFRTTSLGDAVVRMSGRECFGELMTEAGIEPVLTRIPLHPTDSARFPQLVGVANMFQKYRFRKLRWSWKPMCPLTTTGAVAGYIQADAVGPQVSRQPSSFADFVEATAGALGPVCVGLTGEMDFSSIGYPFYDMMSPNSAELSTYAELIVALGQGPTPSVSGGILYLDYEVEFQFRIFPPTTSLISATDSLLGFSYDPVVEGKVSHLRITPVFPFGHYEQAGRLVSSISTTPQTVYNADETAYVTALPLECTVSLDAGCMYDFKMICHFSASLPASSTTDMEIWAYNSVSHLWNLAASSGTAFFSMGNTTGSVAGKINIVNFSSGYDDALKIRIVLRIDWVSPVAAPALEYSELSIVRNRNDAAIPKSDLKSLRKSLDLVHKQLRTLITYPPSSDEQKYDDREGDYVRRVEPTSPTHSVRSVQSNPRRPRL